MSPERPRYAFLGPEGTFTEAALRRVADEEGSEFVPAASVISALAAVRAGEVDRAMVPIENSVEGGVTATLDAVSVAHNVWVGHASSRAQGQRSVVRVDG